MRLKLERDGSAVRTRGVGELEGPEERIIHTDGEAALQRLFIADAGAELIFVAADAESDAVFPRADLSSQMRLELAAAARDVHGNGEVLPLVSRAAGDFHG